MEVKTESGGTFDAAGKGSTALGIVGTVLGGAGLLGGMGGLLGNANLFGNNNRYCDQREKVITTSDLNQEKAYASLFADYKMEQAERYTDKAVIARAEQDAVKQAKLSQDLLDIGIAVTKINEQMKCNAEKQELRDQILDLKIKSIDDNRKASDEKLWGAIALESERRTNGDQNLYGYVNGTFVPGKLIMPTSSICPEVMPLKNSWTAPTA